MEWLERDFFYFWEKATQSNNTRYEAHKYDDKTVDFPASHLLSLSVYTRVWFKA